MYKIEWIDNGEKKSQQCMSDFWRDALIKDLKEIGMQDVKYCEV